MILRSGAARDKFAAPLLSFPGTPPKEIEVHSNSPDAMGLLFLLMPDENFFNAIIVLSIITALPVPNLVRWIIEHYQIHFVHMKKEAFILKEGQDEVL